MALFKKVPVSIAPAVPTVLSGNLANVDTSGAQAGWGLAEYGGGESQTQPVPGEPTGSPVTMPAPAIPKARGQLQNRSRAGAWGHNAGPDRWGTPALAYRGDGPTQGATEGLAPAPETVNGYWTNDSSFTTNDIQSYDKDTRGWVQLHPNDREASWLTFGHSNPLNNPTWMGYSENVTRAPLANTGVDYTTYDNTNVGGFQIGNGAKTPGWLPAGSNIAYESPGPANTVTSAAASQASYDPGMEYV
jgi:hypothetical protein